MDIKGDWKKRAVCGLMVLAMALSLLPTSILAADTRSVTDNAIKNGSFEEPAFHDKNSPQWDANNVPDWSTTASDQLIEFGSTRKDGTVPHIVGEPNLQDSGCQFAELNADEESTLYQYATTVGGNVYEWGLSHRGREGDDHMALIIGPKQDEKPDKPNKAGKDQFMRMTDWVKSHAEKLGVNIPVTGCTQKITVYSKKFAANGGFQNDIGDAFSASPSDVYTEKWNVWIIGTSNTAWGNYGTKSSAYAAGNLAYSCRYAVPDGQTKTVFAFCSYSAATSNKTLGNLIDNIHFSLYQTITAAATAGGSGFIGVPTGNVSEYYPIGSSMSKRVVADGSTITVQAVEPDNDVQFVGAYVTRQTQNGLKKEFIPATSPSWDKVDRTYTYEHPVEEPADIVLVFVKKPMVIYEANGGDQYTHGDNGTNAVSFAQQVRDDGSKTERLPYESQEATTKTKDGWRFDGWLLARKEKVLPAVHTVSYDTASETFTFTADDGTKETLESGGATLIAQWKWRQRFVTASREKNADGTVSDDFRVNAGCGTVEIVDHVGESVANNPAAKDYFASASERVTVTAAANAGYEFIGWYQQVDGEKYDLVSSKPTHSYTVSREGVQTIYARFAPTHTVTYQWASVAAGKCPQNTPDPPSPGTVIDGGTYYISKDFIKDKTTIDGTVTKDGRTVPGKWVFTGWHDGKEDGSSENDVDIVIRETELIKVTGDRTLTGFWTFIPEKEHTLTYQFADNTRWSPSGSFELTENYYRGESVTAQAEPDRNQTTDEEGNPIDVLVTGNVTLYGDWSFNGWKRSDNDSTIAAGRGFNMPGKDLTLTGQWEFTPYTYTVVYDTGDGKPISDPKYASYDYAALLGSSKSGLNAPTGIPFGASIELMELPDGTKIPNDKYFAGWSIVDPTNADLGTIETQAPGDSVGYRKLGITKDKRKVTLYAVYKNKDMATVDFAVNDSNWGDVNPKSGSFMVQNGKVDEGTVSSTAAPRDGYHFVGWYEESDDGKLEPVNGSAINGTTLTVTAAMMQAKLKPLAESREENRTPVLEVRYIAVFARDSFTVKFDGNGDDKEATMKPQTFPAPDSEEQLTTLRKNEFKRPGYVFTGWAEYPTREVGQEERIYADEAPFAEVTIYQGNKIVDGGTITLYAQWEKLSDVIIFYTPEPTSLGTVKLNGTAAKENDTITVQEGTVYESLNPETGEVQGATAVPGKGSVFVGWYDAQDTERSNRLIDSTTYTPKKDSSGRYQEGSYVALFRLKQYVLRYDANGGTGTMEDQTFPHGQAHPLEKCAFSREGYSFVGWATEQEGKVKYEDQKSIKLDEEFPNLTNDNDEVYLYAVWEEQSVTLSYEPNDAELGSVSKASETVDAVTGTAKGSTAQPKSGARFDGWYSADGALLSKELTFVPTKKDGAVWQGTTYYAHFSAKRSPSTPSTPAKPDETKPTLAPIPEMLNGEDHYAYLLGYEDGTVRPNGSISRAEVATVLFRLLKDDVRMQNLTKDNAYSDVSDTAWYAAAVSTLSKMGVISGYPDGTFRPNAPITRAEFAAMIARFDETAKSADTPFTDISGHWAENAISKAYGNGWVEGSSKTVFCPESNLTRAETATLLNRVLHRLPEKESDLLANQVVWPDNPETFWGYLAIQEATNSHEYERKADGVHETQTAKRENRDWSKEFEQ